MATGGVYSKFFDPNLESFSIPDMKNYLVQLQEIQSLIHRVERLNHLERNALREKSPSPDLEARHEACLAAEAALDKAMDDSGFKALVHFLRRYKGKVLPDAPHYPIFEKLQFKLAEVEKQSARFDDPTFTEEAYYPKYRWRPGHRVSKGGLEETDSEEEEEEEEKKRKGGDKEEEKEKEKDEQEKEEERSDDQEKEVKEVNKPGGASAD